MIRLFKNYTFYIFELLLISFVVSLYNSQNPIDAYYMRLDSTFYQYVGKMILEGQIPYRDIFDHKGPVIYLWHALGQLINPMWGQWLIEFILLFLSLCIAFCVCVRFVHPLISLLILGIVFLYTPYFDTIGNTSSFAMLFLFIFLQFFVDYLQLGYVTNKKTLILGICSAILFLSKPTHLIMPIIFILTVLCDYVYQKKFKDIFKIFCIFLTSFLIINIIVLGWLYCNDALSDFFYDYIVFNKQYIEYWQQRNDSNFIFNLFAKNKFIISSSIASAVILIGFKHYTASERKLFVALFISGILCFYSILLPNNPFEHYLHSLFPIFIMLFVLAIKLCNKIYSFISIVLLSLFIYASYDCYNFLNSRKEEYSLDSVVYVIKSNLNEGEKFQNLGWGMGVLHLLTGHNAATKYPMIGMIARINPYIPIEDVKKAEPKIVTINAFENKLYIELLQALWPEFFTKYTKIYYNTKYDVYKRNI